MGYTIAEEQCQKYLTCKFLFGGKSQISLLFRLDKVIQESQETCLLYTSDAADE